MKKCFFLLLIFTSLFLVQYSYAQFTRQDTLRGSIGRERSWWDVLKYDVTVTPDYNTKSITGKTTIQYKITEEKHSDYLQIDLQRPLKVDSFYYDGRLYINYPAMPYYNEGNVWHIPLPKAPKNSIHTISIFYQGIPVEAKRPPWDGGWIWQKDSKGRPWLSVACQGLGASVWFPCKDHQSDEPDSGATITIIVPDTLVTVANGRLIKSESENGQSCRTWKVINPINTYNIIPYIGKYTTWHEDYKGEKGNLDCDFWVLDYNLEKAKEQFKQASMTLKAFEHWFGPYPFYEDGFKLVEAPHLGMEHQSAVAYGNGFKNGYRGRDLSATGWGLKWDFIIVHETGHEWFGNNITSKDIADMWIHEGFTNYSETLFTDFHFGKEAGNEYCIGTRKLIQNDKPIIGPYGVNQEGSSDMYYKGGNMLHTIRQIINDDEKFRMILRGLNKDFYHQTVTTQIIEKYISEKSGIDLSKVFDQYLRTTMIPVLEFKIAGDNLSYRWSNSVPGFNMPVRLANTKDEWLKPSAEWKSITVTADMMSTGLEVDKNFYITVKKL
jgi:aminopeptidase N